MYKALKQEVEAKHALIRDLLGNESRNDQIKGES